MSKRLKTWGVVALLGAQGALAVTLATPGVAGAAAAPRTFACPASGHHPPMYGTVGRNGGDGPAAVEIASPCLNPEPMFRFLEPEPCVPTGIPEEDPYNCG